jgi:hypothetical protein
MSYTVITRMKYRADSVTRIKYRADVLRNSCIQRWAPKRVKAKAPFSNVTVFHHMGVIALLKISTVLSHRYNFNYIVFIFVHKSRSHSGKSARYHHSGPVLNILRYEFCTIMYFKSFYLKVLSLRFPLPRLALL